jgi:hypothetical protein
MAFCPRVFPFTVTFLGVILDIVLTSTSAGVCPQPQPAPNAEFFKSESVFVGEVLSETPEVVQGDVLPQGWFYQLRVEKTFRGPALKTLSVYTEDTNVRYPLKVGEKYLLFAHQDEGRLSIDSCGNSNKLSEAAGAIDAIEAIKHAGPYGEVEGRVQTKSAGVGIPGVRVIARRGKSSYSTITVQDGWFKLRVPPGKYKLTIQSPTLFVEPQDFVYNYDDPDHFIVHRGSSAHFEYLAWPR